MEILSLIVEILGVPSIIVGIIYGIYKIRHLHRDRPKIEVLLRWDVPNYSEFSTGAVGEVLVTNSGRKHITITQIDLVVHVGGTIETLPVGKYGDTLREGDQPKKYRINQSALKMYSNDWRNIQAVVTDSSGKPNTSKIPQVGPPPSWVISPHN